MLSPELIESLNRFLPSFQAWERDQILQGFGHEGLNLIAVAYHNLFNSYPNMSCTPCVVQAVNAVYRELKKANELSQTHS